jgi:hypothetical protein
MSAVRRFFGRLEVGLVDVGAVLDQKLADLESIPGAVLEAKQYL